MFASYSQSSISLLSVLCVIFGASNAATVPPISKFDLQTVDSGKGNETSRVIVYGRTEDKVPIDLLCECVLYYQCDFNNAIVLPTSHHDNDQNQCQGEIEVCCAMRNETSSPSSASSPEVNTFSSEDRDTAKIITYGITDDGAKLQCQCTVFYLCNEQDWITLATTNQDENRCLDPNVCCKIPEGSVPVTEVDRWPSNVTEPKVITYEVIEGDQQIKLRCHCTLFYECLPDDYVELPKSNKNEDQCPESHVCCKEPVLYS